MFTVGPESTLHFSVLRTGLCPQLKVPIMIELPMLRVEQFFGQSTINDPANAVRRVMRELDLKKVRGKHVAITAGSRGIPNIARILRTVVVVLQEAGAEPFAVPCMGSHGGATPSGQLGVLEEYGITERSIGCPILAEMDVCRLGEVEGMPVYWSKQLHEADFVIPINRIAAHTLFCGTQIESGLCKMLAVGGGRKRGAESIHSRADTVGLEQAVLEAARVILEHGNVLGGIAILDNAKFRTSVIEAVPMTDVEGFIAKEASLLKRALEMLAQFNLGPRIDLVYLQCMGKNISGSGSDPNVIGKMPGGWRRDVLDRPNQAEILHVCCSSLTPESHGNGGAIGLHDGITRRLMQAVNWKDTRLNAEVSCRVDISHCPPIYANDIEMLQAALERIRTEIEHPRIVFARSTKYLRVLYISESLRPMVEGNDRFRILSEVEAVRFDDDGYLDLDFEAR